MAHQVLAPFLTDFSSVELNDCITRAYNSTTFDAPSVIGMKKLSSKMSVMELWHGPTAAFKDVALQIMPHFMQYSKQKINNKRHTVILVATSGDTGKAALEGFKTVKESPSSYFTLMVESVKFSDYRWLPPMETIHMSLQSEVTLMTARPE